MHERDKIFLEFILFRFFRAFRSQKKASRRRKTATKQAVDSSRTRQSNVKTMKLLHQILFATLLVIGFSLTALAQDNREEKKKPPKENVEIKPEDKKPKNNENQNNNNQNNNNRGRKPPMFFLISENRIEITSI
jgi:hypothetical protein